MGDAARSVSSLAAAAHRERSVAIGGVAATTGPALAGHTYAFRELPLEEALDALHELGHTRVEVWLGHVRRSARQAAQAVEQRGLRAAAVSAGGFHPSDPSAPARAYELAHELATSVVVATVSPLLLDAVAAAVPEEVTLCVENHWDQALAAPRDVLSALASRSRLASCLDTGHAIMAGVRPDVFARRLGSRLAHVHLKDARPPTVPERLLGRRLRRRLLGRPAPVFPGAGALAVDALRQALAAIRYEGTVTLEYEGGSARAPAALRELSRRWSADPPSDAPATRAERR